jgi:AcrR family transcriptional regulator
MMFVDRQAEPVTAEAAEEPDVERARSTQEALIAAGLKCFAERGFTGSRLVDIVETAGLTTGAFYRRFSSKLDFFHALFMAYGEDLQSALAESADLRELVAAWVAVARRHRGVVRAAAEVVYAEPSELEARRRLRDACAGIMAQQLESPRGWHEARHAALLLADVVAQYVFMEAAGWLEQRDPDEVADSVARLVDHGLYGP